MARKALIIKANSKPKFSSRIVRRCKLCGRPRAYYRKFEMCRICLREAISRNEVPGMTKSSW